ncbi:MAG: phosphatase [Epsilonproteobacteria bacterium]|nr:phosphatase [Campylobacterota bacterium]
MIACDLGSNTLRVVQMDCETKKRVKEFEKIVKTADMLEQTGEISKAALIRIIDAIKEAKKVIDFSSDEVAAVATAALRRAANREKVINRIKNETGIEFDIINGTEEANLTALAVKEALKKFGLEYEDFILLDLGGGSSELYIQKNDRAFIKSFDLGIVTLTQKYNSQEELQKQMKSETKEIKKFIDEIYSSFGKPQIFVSTAGTATTLASLKAELDYEHYDHTVVNGTILYIDDIDDALYELLDMSEEKRSRWVGVGRADLIFSGISIIKNILNISGFDKMVVIDDGLREGLALSKCNDKA